MLLTHSLMSQNQTLSSIADSLYTERFMGLPTPADNLYGYNHTDVARRVEGIRGKKYMLIHGTGDDNVHYQQSMALNKALVDKDIMFEQQSYTDEAHALSGVFPHLYHTMDRFWANCLGYSHTHWPKSKILNHTYRV